MPITNKPDRTQLQDLMLNYAAGVDDRDVELYKSCFADDVQVIGFGDQTFNDRDAWVNYVWTALEKYGPTQHMLGPQLATIDGDKAQTRNDVQAFHMLKDGSAEQFILWATYKTEMTRINGDWKISRHELIVRGTKTQ